MDAPPRQSAQGSLGPVVAKATATKPGGEHTFSENHLTPPSVVRIVGKVPI
jgi:hypothetical protein